MSPRDPRTVRRYPLLVAAVAIASAVVVFPAPSYAAALCTLTTAGEACLGPFGITGGYTNTTTSETIYLNQPAQLFVSVSGTNPPYTWSIISGALPAGFIGTVVDQATELEITGTPTTSGTFSFTVQVVDSIGDSYSGTLSIVVPNTNLPPTTGNTYITSLSPSFVAAGGADFTLTVNGTDLNQSYYLQWAPESGSGAYNCSTYPDNICSAALQYVNGTTMTAVIPTAWIATPGLAGVRLITAQSLATNVLPFSIVQPGSAPPSPVLTSVSPVSAQQNQTITLTGTGFGTQNAYNGDSQYLEISDLTGNWTAGFTGNQVALNVTSWTNTQIVIQNFTGDYGQNNWVVNPGDQVKVSVWNPQSGAGPASLTVTAAAGAGGSTNPVLNSVSTVTAQQNQTITLTGTGFGTQNGYNGDSQYLEIADLTGNWTAGWINNGAPNQVTLNVTSWTNTQIVIQNFTGNYGQNNWVLNPGDQVKVSVWNPQSGAGPASLTVTAATTGGSPSPVLTSVSPIAPQEIQTITLTGTGFGTQNGYNGDSQYLEIADLTGNWTAGWINNGAPNQVTLNVTSWTNTQIVIQNFTGNYGQNNWVLNHGDQVKVSVWNPQSGAGPASLTVTAATAILNGGVLNAASYAVVNGQGAPVAPGSLVAIFTSALAAQAASFSTASLPNSLGGVSVTFNGISAPMVQVVPTGANPYVSVQVPFEVLTAGQTSSSVPAVITVNGAASAAVQASIVPSAPGIFTIPPTGQGNAILVFTNPATNGPAIAAPTNASIGYPTAPIPRGTSGFFYVTGLGAMTPSVADGSGACPAANGQCNANAAPEVSIGGVSAQVQFAGQAPGFPGIFQVNIEVPQNAPPGNSVPLIVKSADGSVTSNTATIAVQ